MLEHQTRHIIAAHAATNLVDVLEQVRSANGAPLAIALNSLSLVFATPDHFRALDAIRTAKADDIVFAVDDPHRTGLALAFGYRVQPLDSVTSQGEPTRSVVTRIGAGTRSMPMEPPPRAPRIDATANDPPSAVPVQRTRRRWIWIVGACIAVVALLTLAAVPLVIVRVHRATVDLYPAEEPFARVVPFAVSADAAAANDGSTLQTHPITTNVARETDIAATGTKRVPDATAAGTVTLRSRADAATTIKAGTTLRGSSDLSVVVLTDVVVPGLDFGKGQLGEATARVRASVPGPAGNLAAGYTARYTDNITYIFGEISGGTEKQITVVSDDDVARGRAQLESEIQLHALADINANLPPGVTPLNDFLTKQTPTVTVAPQVGTEGPSVHVRMSVPVQIPVYDNSAFQALVRDRIAGTVAAVNQSGGGAKEVVPNSITSAPPVQLGIEGKVVHFQTEVHGTLRAVITGQDAARIGRTVAAKATSEARLTIAADPGVGRFTITNGPSWLPTQIRDRMPRRASNISVRIMAAS